jgi:hypothetical protein
LLFAPSLVLEGASFRVRRLMESRQFKI